MPGLNLDLKKLALPKMTKEQQQYAVGGALGVAALVVGFFLYVLGPLNAEIATLTKTRDDKEKTLEQARTLDQHREEYQERLARVQQGNAYLAMRLPAAGSIGASAGDLVKTLTEADSYLKSLRPDTSGSVKSEFEGLTKSVVRIEVDTDFKRFGDFVAHLEGQAPICYIENVTLDQQVAGLTQFITLKGSLDLVQYLTTGASK